MTQAGSQAALGGPPAPGFRPSSGSPPAGPPSPAGRTSDMGTGRGPGDGTSGRRLASGPLIASFISQSGNTVPRTTTREVHRYKAYATRKVALASEG